MKITIDTKEDSHHEIKKVIELLHTILGNIHSGAYNTDSEYSSGQNPESVSGKEQGIFNLFDDSAPKEETPSVPSNPENAMDMFAENSMYSDTPSEETITEDDTEEETDN